MSPLSLRRYRAERLLRQEFEGLRAKVLTTVRGRLAAQGVRLDASDLEDCYAQAWQGLYKAVLDGQEIANPTGWLVLVTFRRAIEDQRSRHYEQRAADVEADEQGLEPDLASQMDDLRRLRQVFEALRERLNQRECQAASLCYLQGLSRAQAAERMGISESRMRKLMEGDGRGRVGVAGKMGELLSIIRDGAWCEEQSSLMRGLAFGILDPEGERYQLALLHQRECPACRAYVASLRGLAAVLPPLALPAGLGAGAAVGVSAGAGAGALSASSGAAGVGGAGGGWLLAGGSLTVKLAGCLVALGIGAGCLALTTHSKHHRIFPRTPVAMLDGSQSTAEAAFLPLSSGTTMRELAGKQVRLKSPESTGQRHLDSPRKRLRYIQKKRSSRTGVNPSEAALAEFGPERSRALEAQVTNAVPEPEQKPNVPAPPPVPSSTASSPQPESSSHGSSQERDEFGFE